MARQVRIEYAGAIYHVMARGNRRERIVNDDCDRLKYEEMWQEAVNRTGWKVYAWILMDNHYHALIETPEPNLVEGMKWVQNTWTRRYNSRHKLWGHLFGGRYKSILCDKGDYLKALIDYIHLNPVRAGMIELEQQLESYRWSSLRDYVLPVRKRRSWIDVSAGLKTFDRQDSAEGRAEYLARLNQQVDWSCPKQAGVVRIEEQTLQSTLQRGWYFGTESYREKALAYLGQIKSEGSAKLEPVSGYSGSDTKNHSEAKASQIIRAGMNYFELEQEHLSRLKKGDWRKVVIACLIREHTIMKLDWISKELNMGAVPRVSQCVNQMQREGSFQNEKAEVLRYID